MRLSYKGTRYHGWQSQPNAVTVQETIEKALSLLLRYPTKITGAGRTDTGVHAREMFAHFDTEYAIDAVQLVHRLNSFLPSDIALKSIKNVPSDAHARFDAIARSYTYYIHNRKNPFLDETSWLLSKKLNVNMMNKAAKFLLDFDNFQSFSKTHTDVKTFICDVKEAYWEVQHEQLIFHITADRFLRNMVRAIVGTLLEVGLGKILVDDFVAVVLAKDRNQAGFSVPAKGLFLTKIEYPKDIYYGND